MKAYYALPRFRPDSPFRPWLLKIVANEARNRARSTRRRQGLALRAAAVSDGDAAPSPETAALAVADRETLIAALNALPTTGPGSDRVPVPPRPVGERDSRRARRAPGDGQVPSLEGDGSPARGVGGAGMSERLRSMGDDDLGAALASLDIEWPSTPLLHAAVMARATSERPAIVRLPLSRPKRIMLIAAATVLLLAGAAVAAKIVIDLGGVVVEVTPGRPGILPTPSIAPTGEPVSLEEAAVMLGRRGSRAHGSRPARPRLGGRGHHGEGRGRPGHARMARPSGAPGGIEHGLRSRPDGVRGRRQPGFEGPVRRYGRPASSRASTGWTTTGRRARTSSSC